MSSMRVGINVFETIFGEGSGPGAGRYVVELLRHLLTLQDDVEYVVFVNPIAAAAGWFPSGPRCRQFVVPLDARRKWLRPVWEQCGLPIVARRLGLDVVHSPFNTTPVFHPAVATVGTVTDLAYFYYQQHHQTESDIKARYYRGFQPLMFRRATHLIAISEFTRQEVIRHLKIAPDKVTAVPLGPGQSELATPADGSGGPVGESGQRDVLLTIGSGMLHKNLLGLLEAYAQAALPAELRLVIAGEIPQQARRRMVTQGELARRAQELGIADRVVIRGYVSPAELKALFGRAIAFVFPSLYEGFGLPILEAMRCGVPVLSSRSAALPEVGGDAALYFDASDPSDIARAMQQIVSDEATRRALVEKGYRQLGAFSWEGVAANTVGVYRRAAGVPLSPADPDARP
jgi:glycosyltransferase involved in cell wall biosynthesis